MAGYVGKVQIGENEANAMLIGSTLYGICPTPADTAAKTVTNANNIDSSSKFINTNYDTLIQGTTIHVKFTLGNNVASNATLQVGTTNQAKPIDGKFICDSNTIISFTYDENGHWVVNDNVDTNTEYVFKTAYNATTNKALTESDIAAAATHGVVTSLNGNTSSNDLPTAAAVASYVQEQTGGLSGLTSAMHFRGQISAQDWPISAADSFSEYISGDVVLAPNDKEYVYVKGNDAASSEWIELGDESSYALKSSTATVIGIAENGFTANTLPQLTITPVNIPNVTSGGTAATLDYTPVTIPVIASTNTPTSLSVSGGVLTITPGVAASFGTSISASRINDFDGGSAAQLGTNISIGSASGWNAGSQASLTPSSIEVVVPDNNPNP